MIGFAARCSESRSLSLELEAWEDGRVVVDEATDGTLRRPGSLGVTLLLWELVPLREVPLEDSFSEMSNVPSRRVLLSALVSQSVEVSSVVPHPERMRLSIMGNRKTCFFMGVSLLAI